MTQHSKLIEETEVESDGPPAWIGSLADRIWISPDIDDVDSDIAREMEDEAASS